MPSTTPYKLWIRGVNAQVNSDSLSECVTGVADAFPGTIATPSVPNGWTLVGFYASHPEDAHEGEPYPVPGGERFDDVIVFRQWDINIEFHTFPNDESIREAVYAHLRKNQLFIAFDTYEALAPQHTVGKVVAVNRALRTEHKDNTGVKQLGLILTKRVQSA